MLENKTSRGRPRKKRLGDRAGTPFFDPVVVGVEVAVKRPVRTSVVVTTTVPVEVPTTGEAVDAERLQSDEASYSTPLIMTPSF